MKSQRDFAFEDETAELAGVLFCRRRRLVIRQRRLLPLLPPPLLLLCLRQLGPTIGFFLGGTMDGFHVASER